MAYSSLYKQGKEKQVLGEHSVLCYPASACVLFVTNWVLGFSLVMEFIINVERFGSKLISLLNFGNIG